MKPALWFRERAEAYTRLGCWTSDKLAAALDRNAERMPAGGALSDETRSWSWAEVRCWTDAVACALIRRGLPRDAVLATWLPNWVENYLLRMACEKAGLIWLPIPRAFRPHELLPILRTAGAVALVLTESDRRDHYAEAQQILPSLPALRWLFLARGEGRPGAAMLAELAAEAVSPADLVSLPARSCRADEVAMIVPTSGSTGAPKLAEYVAAATVIRGRAQAELFHLTAKDVIVATAQGFGPSVTALFASPVVGAEVVVLDHTDPALLLRLIAQRAATVVCGLPPIYHDLLAALRDKTADVASVRIWYSTGMAMPVSLARSLEQATSGVVLSGYGAADFGCWTAPAPEDPPQVRWFTVGRPRGGTEIQLVATEGDTDGEGEVWGRGPCGATGYFEDAAATREAWTQDGWFRSGDIGRVDERGNLLILGRKQDVINRGGHKIFPAEIEHLLERHPRIARAALVPFPDDRLGQRVCACVVPAGLNELSLEDVVRFLRKFEIASYKLPDRLEVVSHLPLTSGGKVARHALRAQLSDRLRSAS